MLKDSEGNQYEITFNVQEETAELSEPYGKRLLVGKYVLYQGRPAYVKSLRGNKMVEIIETISKIERKVLVSNLSLIEKFGVNVYQLDKEP